MNQQNKTERWDEDFDNKFCRVSGTGTMYWKNESEVNLQKKEEIIFEIKDFISQLLSDARREERERCLEAFSEAEKHATLPNPNPFGRWVSIPSHNRTIREMRKIFEEISIN